MKQPNEFYFAFLESEDGPCFLVTSKKYWDRHHCLDDRCGFHNTPLPDSFSELMEATFEYEGNPSNGIQELLALGFTQNQEMLLQSFIA